MKRDGSTTVVYAALGGNLAIAVTKFGAALYTGSSAMFTEALHSLVDTVDQGLLLYGMHRARRPPDEAHPFGYGLELYFWSFVVALLIFSLGGAFAIYEGVEKIRHPESIRNAWVNFTVLGLAVLFEGYSFGVAWREMRRRHADVGMWSALRRSKDPSTFTLILEDGAALTGLGLAAIGVAVSVGFDEPCADGGPPSPSACSSLAWRSCSRGRRAACSWARAPRRRSSNRRATSSARMAGSRASWTYEACRSAPTACCSPWFSPSGTA
jgi:hypothetical protein